jgi:hypothetical protein
MYAVDSEMDIFQNVSNKFRMTFNSKNNVLVGDKNSSLVDRRKGHVASDS